MKDINVSLMTDDVSGILSYTSPTWTGTLYKIPKGYVNYARQHFNFSDSDICFAFGKDSNGLWMSVCNMNKLPEKYDVIFVTVCAFPFKDEARQTIIDLICTDAMMSGKVDVRDHIPCESTLNATDWYFADSFAKAMRSMIILNGYNVFDSLFDTTYAGVPKLDDVSYDVYMTRRRAQAHARYTNTGMVLLAGSILVPESMVTKSTPKSALKDRKKYVDKIDGNVLREDILFNTPSGAGAFVILSAANGYDDWCDENGTSLRQLMDYMQ